MRTEGGLVLLTPDGQVEWADGGTRELLGYTSEQLSARATPFWRIASDHPRHGSGGQMAEALAFLASGQSTEAEGDTRLLAKSGRVVPVHWRIAKLPSGTGGIILSLSQPSHAGATGQNLSWHEHSVEGFFRCKLDGQLLEANHALAAIYGFSTSAELVSAAGELGCCFYVQPSRHQELMAALYAHDAVKAFESQVFRADGTTIWIAEFVRLVRNTAGDPLYYEGSAVEITARKEAERELQISEAKFRHLVESTNVIPFEADVRNGRIIHVGTQASRLLHVPLEEWKRPNFLTEHTHPRDREWVALVRSQAVERQESYECEFRMIDTFGRVICVREIASLLPKREGSSLLGGFFLDVTHSRKAEESLRESYHVIEQIASASPTILYLYNPETRLSVHVSGRVQDILGLTPEGLAEMQPFFVLSLAHPDDGEMHRQHLDSILHGSPAAGVLVREFRLRTASGHWVWVNSRECVFKISEDGRVTGVVGTLADVTEHRLAMERLKSSEALFRQLAETTRVVPFDFDLGVFRFSYVGPQAESLLGYPLLDWYAEGFWRRIVHEEDLEDGLRFASPDEASGDSDGDFETEFRLVTAAGAVKWVRQIVHYGSGSERAHVKGFFFDITAAKLAEVEREESRQQLRELAARNQIVREEERGRVAREIHDELGQALTSFRLDLAWMRNQLEAPPSEENTFLLKSKIASTEEMIGRTLQTVRRIITALRPPLLDDLGLCEALTWHARDFSKRVGIRCEADIAPVDSIPETVGIAIFRVFQEALTNVARHARASRIRIRFRDTDDMLVLEVTDNGCGLPPNREEGKTSFGLLGMKERAWMVGGELAVESEPGVKTSVILKVPHVKSLPRNNGEQPAVLRNNSR